ncbi:hypothetical protein N9B73_02190 [Verrucomicrobiales bacterium]|nr:hypothetical protein [Verrucomicrobiales bacterium]
MSVALDEVRSEYTLVLTCSYPGIDVPESPSSQDGYQFKLCWQ